MHDVSRRKEEEIYIWFRTVPGVDQSSKLKQWLAQLHVTAHAPPGTPGRLGRVRQCYQTDTTRGQTGVKRQ